jgi:hypothetical protein
VSYGGREVGMKTVGNDRKTLKPLPFSYFFIGNGNSRNGNDIGISESSETEVRYKKTLVSVGI